MRLFLFFNSLTVTESIQVLTVGLSFELNKISQEHQSTILWLCSSMVLTRNNIHNFFMSCSSKFRCFHQTTFTGLTYRSSCRFSRHGTRFIRHTICFKASWTWIIPVLGLETPVFTVLTWYRYFRWLAFIPIVSVSSNWGCYFDILRTYDFSQLLCLLLFERSFGFYWYFAFG